jgi:hypothetical protein
MVSLVLAQAVRELEAEGWMIVEPSSKQAKGGPILMKQQSDGDLIHILVTSRANSRWIAVPRGVLRH